MENLIVSLVLAFFVVIMLKIGKSMSIEYKIYRIKAAYVNEYKMYIWEIKETDLCTLNLTEARKLKIPYIRNDIGTFKNNIELRKSFIKAGYLIREIFEKYDCKDYEIEQIFAEVRKIAFSNGEVTRRDLLF